MTLFAVLAAVIVLLLIGPLLVTAAHARFFRAVAKSPSYALPTDDDATQLDRHVQSLSRGQNAASGLALLTSNLDAFAARVMSARSAGRSLDLMYYMWNSDLTGRLIMGEVIAAADRGVRVRLLLDDLGVSMSDRVFHAIDCHPNIELRLFNPTRARTNAFHRGIEMILRFRSVNRRMHNKAWIADGRVAVVGGRNIGDEYFDAAMHANFRDFDLVAIGKLVSDTEDIFDRYWNSAVAVPVKALLPRRANRLDRLRTSLEALPGSKEAQPYVERLRDEGTLEKLSAYQQLFWVDTVEVLADPPEKAAGKLRRGQNLLMDLLLPVMTGAENALQITSPYFIPGNSGVDSLTKLAATGVDVAVLTNSLAATDVVAVHGGYARYRVPLLKAGVRLYELRSVSEHVGFSLRGSSQAKLHTKAFTRDGCHGFVGSLNLDPRSVSLNTEMGILFTSTELVEKMNEIFAGEIGPTSSYAVGIDERGALSWNGQTDGRITKATQEPDAGLLRRFTATAIGWLPLESQL